MVYSDTELNSKFRVGTTAAAAYTRLVNAGWILLIIYIMRQSWISAKGRSLPMDPPLSALCIRPDSRVAWGHLEIDAYSSILKAATLPFSLPLAPSDLAC